MSIMNITSKPTYINAINRRGSWYTLVSRLSILCAFPLTTSMAEGYLLPILQWSWHPGTGTPF